MHDFSPKSHAIQLGPVSYNAATHEWHPHFNVKVQGETFHTVSPYDFNTIYNVLPLWKRGFTGKGVTIALVEDFEPCPRIRLEPFASTFGLKDFKDGNFKQIYPNCNNPGQNGDEIEAALDVEWASVAAPMPTSSSPRAAIPMVFSDSTSRFSIFSTLSRPTSSPTVTACARPSLARPKLRSRIAKRKSPPL